jgi:hypothetical protein
MGKPHTNGFWQKPLPVCHLRLETLQSGSYWQPRDLNPDQQMSAGCVRYRTERQHPCMVE